MYPPTFRDLSSEFEQREKKVLIWKGIHSFVVVLPSKEAASIFVKLSETFSSLNARRENLFLFFFQVTRQNLRDLRTK